MSRLRLRPPGFAQTLSSRALRAQQASYGVVSPGATPTPAQGPRSPISSQPGAIGPCSAWVLQAARCSGPMPHAAVPWQPAHPPQAAVLGPPQAAFSWSHPSWRRPTAPQETPGKRELLLMMSSWVSSARRAATSDGTSGLSKWLQSFRNKPISPQRQILAPNSPQQSLLSIGVCSDGCT